MRLVNKLKIEKFLKIKEFFIILLLFKLVFSYYKY